MKRFLALVLSAVLLFSAVQTAAAAGVGNDEIVPEIVMQFERFTGNIITVFARLWNILTKTNETDIPSAEIRSENWEASTCNGFGLVSEQTIQAETWVSIELQFESDKQYTDPFNDTDMDLLLCGNGRLYTIPAFWDGGNVWKVRFVCPSAGTWYYKTVCTDAENAGLHNRAGEVVCSQYSGDKAIYQHGFVTTKAGEKYFTYDDCTPFFYLGDTHWSLGDETVDMVRTICAQRVAQGFSVLQSEPIGAAFDMSDGITEADMAGFAVNDEKFKIIADNGLVHANAQFFFPYSMEVLIAKNGGYSDVLLTGKDGRKTIKMHDLADSTKQYLEKITRYWVARYASYPVMWTLGQEVDNDFYWNDTTHPDWNYINNPYKLVAEYIAKYDPYTHPLTAHQENAGSTAAYGDGENTEDECKVYRKGVAASCFRSVASHDFYAAQWTPSKTAKSDYEVEKDYWYNSQGKPVVNYEGQYCYLWTKNFGARMQGWLAFLNGMYGYGWGGHDTWSYLNIYDEENDSSDGVDTITSAEKKAATWQDSLEYESSYQVGYMRTFFEQTEWYNLLPRFDNKAYFVPGNNVYSVYASNADNTEIVVYFYSFSDENIAQNTNAKGYGGIKTGTLGNLIPGAEYVYQWFNPVTGEFLQEESFTASGLGTYYIGARPTATDWALLIRACQSATEGE
ncbi:MAG: DUF4038 domain-containing protein [Clostridia bacterium]|nr:DUF4038 domain-containing protein [Clostridia bacterium]